MNIKTSPKNYKKVSFFNLSLIINRELMLFFFVAFLVVATLLGFQSTQKGVKSTLWYADSNSKTIKGGSFLSKLTKGKQNNLKSNPKSNSFESKVVFSNYSIHLNSDKSDGNNYAAEHMSVYHTPIEGYTTWYNKGASHRWNNRYHRVTNERETYDLPWNISRDILGLAISGTAKEIYVLVRAHVEGEYHFAVLNYLGFEPRDVGFDVDFGYGTLAGAYHNGSYRGDGHLYDWFKDNYSRQNENQINENGLFSKNGWDFSKLPDGKRGEYFNTNNMNLDYFFQTGIKSAPSMHVNWKTFTDALVGSWGRWYEEQKMVYITQIKSQVRPPKAPKTEKPVIRDDQEIIQIEFDSAKIPGLDEKETNDDWWKKGGVDNQYIVGQDWWDEKVMQRGVFNTTLRKDWIDNLTVKHLFWDKASNTFKAETDENLKKQQLETLFGAYGVDMNKPNPRIGYPEDYLNNFLLWKNGVSKSWYHAWDDRRRTLHIPNYLLDEKVNGIMDRVVNELKYVKNNRPVVPELKKGKKYKLSFHRSATKGKSCQNPTWKDLNNCYFFVTSGWEQDENNRPYFSDLPNISDFVGTAVENWGKINDSDLETWGAGAEFHKYIQSTTAGNIPLFQLFQGSLDKNDLDAYWQLNIHDFKSATGNVLNADPDFRNGSVFNVRQIYTQKEILTDFGITWSELLKLAWLKADGTPIDNWELICTFDVNLKRVYSKKLDKEWRRIFPWNITKMNKIGLVPNTVTSSGPQKTTSNIISWNGASFDVDFNKETLPDFKALSDCLIDDKGRIAITFSDQGIKDLWSFLLQTDNKGNYDFTDKPFNNLGVSKIDFQYRVGEDWNMEITKINSITYKHKVPKKATESWWQWIIRIIKMLFSWLDFLPGFVKGILAILFLGTFFYFTGPIWRPLFGIFGSLINMVKNLLGLAGGKKK